MFVLSLWVGNTNAHFIDVEIEEQESQSLA